MGNNTAYLLDFRETGKTKLSLVGGKGANLRELSQMENVQVPEGFCITTEAYKEVIENNAAFNLLLDELSLLKATDRKSIRETSAKIRSVIEEIPIPEGISNAISRKLEQMGETTAYALRSSATAEDLPTASFAGQQDTYLNIIGKEEILKHISKCWASLFTDRAVIYRLQNRFDHRLVRLSFIVQKMIFPDVAGIMFTADPLTSNRKVVSVDASFGLGEALVSGIVNADNYKVREGKIIDKMISVKKRAVYGLKAGGTEEREIAHEKQNTPALTDEQILQLERIGRSIEKHFGAPQDIEWCLAGNAFYIVQSRPITTLFPVPELPGNHVFLSVGHNQMMTDAMKPLGLSFFQLTTKGPMYIAGGRLFVDVAPHLASPESRKMLIENFGKTDLLIKDALMTIAGREEYSEAEPGDGKNKEVVSSSGFRTQIENDPAIVTALIKRTEASVEKLKQDIKTKSGTDLFDFIVEDLVELKKILFDPQSHAVIMAAMDATFWINEKMSDWLGEKNAADALSQSVPDNVTSEMGLALMDVADAIRPYPEVVEYLQHVKEDDFLDKLPRLTGGKETRDAIAAYLNEYGMRCAGEIDITKSRWAEKPKLLVSAILGNIKNFAPGAGKRKFELGLQEALKKEEEILQRLKQLPDGEAKAEETKRMISLVRNFMGYREYPKYGTINRYFLYKQALLKEAGQLVQAGVINEREDIYYLTFEELRELVTTHKPDYAIIRRRKEEYKIHRKLAPPRVMTSEGEIITGTYKRENLPAGALVGLGVSAGIIEGRARVILNMEDADIEEGDILVTAFTDPSWTPLFVSLKGLVTEVGGMMTHGAVIAREYGLPAVVGLENATKLIKDGQQIRVNAAEGYVEIL